MEVNGMEGGARLIRKFVDVAINISEGKDLGLDLTEMGFVRAVAHEGMVAAHNAKQRLIGAPCMRGGDRIVQVSGREPPTEDGEEGDVMPYLLLAMTCGAS